MVFKLWSRTPGGLQRAARGSTSKPRNLKMHCKTVTINKDVTDFLAHVFSCSKKHPCVMSSFVDDILFLWMTFWVLVLFWLLLVFLCICRKLSWTSCLQKYPFLSAKAVNVLLPFSVMYLCETPFSAVTVLKLKYQAKLDIENDVLLGLMHVFICMYFLPCMDIF